MYRFETLEAAGAIFAGMTERSDGPQITNTAVAVRQVHGTLIVEAEDVAASGQPVEADGILVRKQGLAIEIRVADCVPLVLYSPETGAAAAIHAGRRGLEGNIAEKAVTAMVEQGAEPSKLIAAIGPSAGPCCYEVSEEMAAKWSRAGRPATGRMLDLWAESARQLVRAGIPASQMTTAGICTICGDRFASYRREGGSVRNRVILVV